MRIACVARHTSDPRLASHPDPAARCPGYFLANPYFPLNKLSNPNVKGAEVEMGTGNVYADLGLADADETLIKARLVSRIAEIIKRKGLT